MAQCKTALDSCGRGANNPNLRPTYESGYLLLGLDSFVVRSAQNKQTNKQTLHVYLR